MTNRWLHTRLNWSTVMTVEAQRHFSNCRIIWSVRSPLDSRTMITALRVTKTEWSWAKWLLVHLNGHSVWCHYLIHKFVMKMWDFQFSQAPLSLQCVTWQQVLLQQEINLKQQLRNPSLTLQTLVLKSLKTCWSLRPFKDKRLFYVTYGRGVSLPLWWADWQASGHHLSPRGCRFEGRSTDSS